jgi:hypothetical protein
MGRLRCDVGEVRLAWFGATDDGFNPSDGLVSNDRGGVTTATAGRAIGELFHSRKSTSSCSTVEFRIIIRPSAVRKPLVDTSRRALWIVGLVSVVQMLAENANLVPCLLKIGCKVLVAIELGLIEKQ